MKKLLLALSSLMIASGAFASSPTGTGTPADFKWDAEIRTRYTTDSNRNWAKASSLSNWYQREKLGATMMRGDNMSGRLSLVHAHRWGDNIAQGGTAGTAPLPTNGGTFNKVNVGAAGAADYNVLLVNEAWGWWKAGDNWSVRFGRSGFSFGDGTIISQNDWFDYPHSFDGVWVNFNFDFMDLTAFGIKAWDPDTTLAASNNSDPETNIYGAVVKAKNLPDVLKYAGLHFFQTNAEDANVGITGTVNTMRVGLTLFGDNSGFDYRATGDFLSGKAKQHATTTERDLNSSMFDVEAGYTFAEFMKARLSFNYHMDSGDSSSTDTKTETYLPLRPDTHKFGGLMDAMLWGNSTYFDIGLGVSPMDDLKVGLNYVMFSRTKDTDGITTGFGSVADTGDKLPVGSEINLHATKSYGEHFSIHALYGSFTPGDFLKDTGRNETFSRGQVQAQLNF